MLIFNDKKISSYIKSWKAILILSIIIVAGILVRIAELWWHGPWVRDSVMYCQWAEAWHETGVMSHLAQFGAKIGPLYIGLMVCGMKCGLSAMQAGIAVNFFCGLLLIILTYLIALECFNNKYWALWAAVFAAVHPTTVEYSCKVLREMAFLLFTGFWILGTLRGIKKDKSRWWILAGISAAMATLTRVEGLEYFFIMMIIGITAILCDKKKAPQKVLKIAALFVSAWLGTVLILSCWWGANVQYYKEMLRFRQEMMQVNFDHLE